LYNKICGKRRMSKELEEEAREFSSEDDSDSDDGMVNLEHVGGVSAKDMINVTLDFEGFNGDEDYDATRLLLDQGLLTKILQSNVNISKLSNIICNQKAVGTKIISNGEELYSLLTVFNLRKYYKEVFANLFKYFLKKVEDREVLETIINDDKTGILISERFMNTPLQTVPPLFDSVFKDIEWVNKNYIEAGADKDEFRFKGLLVLAPMVGKEYVRFEDEEIGKLAKYSFDIVGGKKTKSNNDDNSNTRKAKKQKVPEPKSMRLMYIEMGNKKKLMSNLNKTKFYY
jgi:hypothetical protein